MLFLDIFEESCVKMHLKYLAKIKKLEDWIVSLVNGEKSAK